MSNKLATRSPKRLIQQDKVQQKFQEILGQKSQGFVTSVLQCISNNDMLSKAEPTSVYNAAMTAAVLDLPINQNLGFAYIIPYKSRGKTVAQFQMGYKGYIQLCQRSGLFKTISATPIYEGQVEKENPLTGFEFNFDNQLSEKVIGYASYFALLNGFEKIFYMPQKKVESHAKEYSQSYRKGFGPWTDNFEGMALKTVLKLLLSKYAPMTIDMEKAVTFDQGEVKDVDNLEVDYVDNGEDVDGSLVGKQITEEVTGSDGSENGKDKEVQEDDSEVEEAEKPFKPSKKQREGLLNKAQYLSKDNQNKLVKFINKDDMTQEEWTTWTEHAIKAKKKAEKEEKEAKKK